MVRLPLAHPEFFGRRKGHSMPTRYVYSVQQSNGFYLACGFLKVTGEVYRSTPYGFYSARGFFLAGKSMFATAILHFELTTSKGLSWEWDTPSAEYLVHKAYYMPEYPTTKDRSDKNIDLITTLPIPDMMVA